MRLDQLKWETKKAYEGNYVACHPGGGYYARWAQFNTASVALFIMQVKENGTYEIYEDAARRDYDYKQLDPIAAQAVLYELLKE
jgi:hypothetical protein